MTQTRWAQISDRCTKAGGKTVRAGPRFSHLHNSRLVVWGWGLCWGLSVGALRVSRTFTIAGSGLGEALLEALLGALCVFRTFIIAGSGLGAGGSFGLC